MDDVVLSKGFPAGGGVSLVVYEEPTYTFPQGHQRLEPPSLLEKISTQTPNVFSRIVLRHLSPCRRALVPSRPSPPASSSAPRRALSPYPFSPVLRINFRDFSIPDAYLGIEPRISSSVNYVSIPL